MQRLLIRKRANSEDTNVLTLGYREAAPGPSGHRVSSSNGVMCFFPNTLVALLKKEPWRDLHAAIGDDLMLHLLLNYVVIIEMDASKRSYIQVRITRKVMTTRQDDAFVDQRSVACGRWLGRVCGSLRRRFSGAAAHEEDERRRAAWPTRTPQPTPR